MFIETIAAPQLTDIKSKAAPSQVGSALYTDELSEKQWLMLAEMQAEMHKEYTMRRQMMIKRLDLTIQSFQASYC